MNTITDNIVSIKVRGYNQRDNVYKLLLSIDENVDSIVDNKIKININWNKVIDGFKLIKHELNKNIYQKLVYDLSMGLVINDRKYNDAKKFLYGIPLSKNIRKISDVQNFFNQLLMQKNSSNKEAINCIFRKTFDILE